MTDILDPTMLRARSAVRCTLLFPAELGPTIAAAVEIADESARCLIECESHAVDADGFQWRDLASIEDQFAETVNVSVRYLESRGQLLRNPTRSSLVRFTETRA